MRAGQFQHFDKLLVGKAQFFDVREGVGEIIDGAAVVADPLGHQPRLLFQAHLTRVLFVFAAHHEGVGLNPSAVAEMGVEQVRAIDLGHLFAFIQISDGVRDVFRGDAKGQSVAVSAPVQPHHQTRAFGGAAINGGQHREAALIAVDPSRLGL